MLKRLSLVLLSAAFLLGVTPVAASAHGGGSHGDDDHYRCMYRCRGDYYYRRGDRDRDPRYCWYKDRYGWYRARCYRHYHRDDYGGGYYRDHRTHSAAAAPVVPFHAGHDHGTKPDEPKHEPKPKPKKPKDEKGHKGHGDSAHAGGGYDSHRSHDGP